MIQVKAIAAVSLLALACAAPSPPPTITRAPTSSPLVVEVSGWTATCADVPEHDCTGVAGLFINNLARNWLQVRDASGGKLQVEVRTSCPSQLAEWADPTTCWQASASAGATDVCMVIARRLAGIDVPGEFGQIGGDLLAGSAFPPPSGWPECE